MTDRLELAYAAIADGENLERDLLEWNMGQSASTVTGLLEISREYVAVVTERSAERVAEFAASQDFYNLGYAAGRRAALEGLVFTPGTQPEPCGSDALQPWWCVTHDSPHPAGRARCQRFA